MDTPIPSGYPPEAKWIQDELQESLLANDGYGQTQAKLIESLLRPITVQRPTTNVASPVSANPPKSPS